MSYINDLLKPLHILIGANGSGKTYALNEAIRALDQHAFLITEDGMPFIPKQMNQVTVNLETMRYNYTDEGSRGQSNRGIEEEIISDRAQKVISYCQEIMGKLDLFKKKSRGQEKLFNMMTIFTTYNLNHVINVYFDEPENFLDEEFLKIIAEFFGILIVNDYRVKVATHNSRLLNILKVNIEDTIFFNNHSQFLVTNDEVKEIYRLAATQVEAMRTLYNIQIDSSIQYKLDLLNHNQAFDSFVEQSLKSEDFYRCLFNKKIIIVEGISDIAALASIKNEFPSSVEIFNPNGKAFIPFFVQLFIKLKKEVVVIIDDDIHELEEGILSKHPVAITKLLKDKEDRNDIRLVIHSPDLEGYYNINLVEIGRTLGMSATVRNSNRGWHKSLAAFIFFSEAQNKLRLKNHILGVGREVRFDFQ